MNKALKYLKCLLIVLLLINASGCSPNNNYNSANKNNSYAEASLKKTQSNKPAKKKEQPEITYVLNTKTKKFHYSNCSYLPTANRLDTDESRSEIIDEGYVPCKKCNP